jgi:hypothetical protein
MYRMSPQRRGVLAKDVGSTPHATSSISTSLIWMSHGAEMKHPYHHGNGAGLLTLTVWLGEGHFESDYSAPSRSP